MINDLSFYQLLGIPEGVSFVEIKQAYKKKYMNQASGEKMLWAARMRMLRNQPSGEP
ncbi:hypothetical protein MKX03_021431 [Papaver bracteatum]|nr:hypothetical protein MKX03_021431 [Papaver bracteatum]